jgi:chaperonin GroES
MIEFSKKLTINKDFIMSPNLCDRLGEEDCQKIGNLVWTGYSRDKQSRTAWERRMEAGMDLAMQIQKEKSFPWPNSANVIFPLVTIAALQFSARSYQNIVQGTDVARYRVIADDPQGELRRTADRISKHMSWQVLEEDLSWEEEHDRLLINLSIVGTNFIKTYFSSSLKHNVSELVLARDFVLDYWAKSVEECARKTHVYPMYQNEIYTKVKNGTFANVLNDPWFNRLTPIAPPTGLAQDNRKGLTPPVADEDTPFRLLEQHRLLDLDGDGYAEPYIATIEESSKKLVRLVARFDREEDVDRKANGTIISIKAAEYFTKYSFIPAPDGGIYDVGFGVLLGPLNEGVNTGINQLLDAGTMSNSSGGFLGRGAKIRGGSMAMAPWEWKRVDSTGDDLRKSLVPLPVREPSSVMFNLIGLIINYTDRLAGTVDQMVGENPGQNTPAETSRNTTEQGMQVYSTIFKRVWRSMKEEFKKLHRLNGLYLPVRQRFGSGDSFIRQEDYRGNPDLIVPSADPRITSQGMRIGQAQALRLAAREVPGYDLKTVELNFLRALQVENAEAFYPGPDKVPQGKNPKVEVEEMRLIRRDNELAFKKEAFIIQLMNDRAKTMAEISKLEAETLKLIAEIGDAKAEINIRAFETAINALRTQHDMITERIEALKGEGDDSKSGGGSLGGGLQRLDSAPSDQSVPDLAGQLAGGNQGAMGGGEFQPGQLAAGAVGEL